MAFRSFPPTSLFQCFTGDERRLDPMKFLALKRHRREELTNRDYMILIAACEAEAEEEAAEYALQKELAHQNTSSPPRKRQRQCHRDETTGQVFEVAYKETYWYQRYIESPELGSKKFNRKFRRRFRCKHSSFLKHLEEVKSSELFKCWGEHSRDCAGKQSVPIELLLLGALRYLGRGWCLDDLEEATNISEETHRRFIHVYITWGATTFHDKYVRMPKDADEANKWSTEYSKAGFPGCISSGDATHVGMLRCQFKLKQYNMSFKLDMPSRTYNIHVTHRRRILYTTSGHPARWNDQTIQRFDDYALRMRDGTLVKDFTFKLFEIDESTSARRQVEYEGPWEIVDNGYLSWPTMVPPSKYSSTYSELRFSQWLESLRKDVECTFGVMKGRFRILKTGIPLHGIQACDKIWKTCCGLHNFLLEEDELDQEWTDSDSSALYGEEYLGQEGHHDSSAVGAYLTIETQQQLDHARQAFDASGMGVGSDVGDDVANSPLSIIEEDDDVDPSGDEADQTSRAIKVHQLGIDAFKQKLIKNFAILWEDRQVIWPSRTGQNNPPPQHITGHNDNT